MKQKLVMFAVVIGSMLCSCTATNTIAKGISEKAIDGDGYVAVSKVGVDPDTKTPTLQGILVKGSYTSIPVGMEFIDYTEGTDCSIFNSNAKTYRKRLVFGSSDRAKIDAVLESVKAAIVAPVAEDK